MMPQSPPAVEDLYAAIGRMLVRFYGRAPVAECVTAPHAILSCSGLDSVFLNVGVIFGDGPASDDPAEGRLREFVARMVAAGTGGHVCLSHSVQAELEPLARELGLVQLPSIPLMARLGGPPPPSGSGSAFARRYTVEAVSGEADIGEFLAVSEAAFELPPGLYGCVVTRELLGSPGLRMYLCRSLGIAVGCVCVVDDGGLVTITGMGTLPRLQGLGIGGGLLGHVLESLDGRTRAASLTAAHAARRFYERHGFAVVDTATAWVVPPPGG